MKDAAPFGTVETACNFLAEMAAGVIAHAAVMQHYAEIRFYPGLDYATRCTASYLRAMQAAHDEVERSRALVLYRKRAEDIGPGQGV
ncbi:hypothetical protein MKK69_04590 [Methylobacterium sp. J-026]|uniref:hypothetical protein n=1 Tax=Methylobacterium sp. J-026 TaxID=2836624 RepID=UPI001FBACCDD|nr:hypothetical protein [Methylobacterium sp. J-026]MCJ2133346.1 hypothetical protein [Methylobacterium sp. J-026]